MEASQGDLVANLIDGYNHLVSRIKLQDQKIMELEEQAIKQQEETTKTKKILMEQAKTIARLKIHLAAAQFEKIHTYELSTVDVSPSNNTLQEDLILYPPRRVNQGREKQYLGHYNYL